MPATEKREKSRAFHFRHYGQQECFLIRLLFALVVWFNLPHQVLELGQPHPNGLAHFIDFSWLGKEGLYPMLRLAAIPALIFYVIGKQPFLTVALTYLTILHVSVYTLYNSQGSVGHSYQIVGLVLLAQLLFSIYSLCRGKSPYSAAQFRSRFIYYSQLIIVGTYLVSGLTKLENSKGRWVQKSPYIGIELIKTDRQNYYSNLDSERFGGEVPLAEAMLESPNLTKMALGSGLLLELIAFLALHSRIASLLLGLALVAMHRGIFLSMGLVFHENEWCLLIFLVNLPYWLWLRNKAEESGEH